MPNSAGQFFKYGVGGGIAFSISFLSLYLLTEKLKLYYLLSSVIAYTSGLFINFVFQAWITFQTKQLKVYKRLFLFLTAQSLGLLLSTSLMFLLTEKIKLLYLISYIISALITFIFNFSLSKYFVFNNPLPNNDNND